jgi:hypothetical protein
MSAGVPKAEESEPIPSDFSRLFRRLFTLGGHTPEKFGPACDCTERTVNNWLSGATLPTRDTLLSIEAALSTDEASRGNPIRDWRLHLREAYDRAYKERRRSQGATGDNLEYGVQISNLNGLRAVYAFDETAYHDIEDISFELFQEWWEAWPSGFLCALRDSEPYAVVGLFPVTEEWATGFLQRRHDENTLDKTVMRASSREYWYLSGLSSKLRQPGLSNYLPSILGYSLLRWADHNAPRIADEKVVFVSEGSTVIGERLLNQLFGFQLVAAGIGGGQKPRFSKRTDITEIKNLILSHKLFLRCENLRHDVSRSANLRRYPVLTT